MRKYPYIKLYLSVSNTYIALSINITFLEQDLIFIQNLWFHLLMDVLLNSYHVTAIPSLNHSLLVAGHKSYHSRFAELK